MTNSGPTNLNVVSAAHLIQSTALRKRSPQLVEQREDRFLFLWMEWYMVFQ
eukprot:CAMPEP_0174257594 /NCGR_PEP_ID=MMETSP0439-20130205/6712_1 /TAXON_ID=0 /ORGANISM="Stereomyxa ramosa, Strain Chinc5" /LENGTH=50 /DNA_ID=CAMNT_0015340751 /DNA_START=964 /DNA_END=1113 /DNA_ORIENTATION=+